MPRAPGARSLPHAFLGTFVANRLFRFLSAVIRYRDVHYARRLLARAGKNLRLVTGQLGAHYVRVLPYRDFGGVDPSEPGEVGPQGSQASGFVRIHLIPYHFVLAEVAGKVVVEAGANEGHGAALLARHAREVHALDISEEAIAAARARHARPNLDFYVHDVTVPFPIAESSADVVFASDVIEHLPDGPAFLDAAERVLRPGGLLILTTPNDDYHRRENRLDHGHVNPYTRARLAAELSERFDRVGIEGLTYDVAFETEPEDRSDGVRPEDVPYSPDEPITIDRVLVTRMRVTPRRITNGTEVPEILIARAVKRAWSV